MAQMVNILYIMYILYEVSTAAYILLLLMLLCSVSGGRIRRWSFCWYFRQWLCQRSGTSGESLQCEFSSGTWVEL